MITIEAKNLSKEFIIGIKEPGFLGVLRSFFNRKTKTIAAVKEISFAIEQGELVGFLGPNGAGKTTTLKLISGLLYPTSGQLHLLGHLPSNREKAMQMRFAMVMGQRSQLWWDLPAKETFLLNQKIYEIPDHEYAEMETELVELLELEDLLMVPVKKLSLGQRMKAEIACSLLHRPQVLLLDEPTLGLDILMQKKLRQFIKEYNRKYRSTILLTSHNMTDVEELCKRVIIINGGSILYDGDLGEIVQRCAPEKLITLSTSRPLERSDLERFGRVVSLNNDLAKIEVPRQRVSQAVGELLGALPIDDLSIEEMPIEEIIERFFIKDAPAFR